MTYLRPQVPDAMRLQEALASCGPLQSLTARLEDSRRRLETIRPLLPGLLARHVKAGPVDDKGWTLLVANAAVGAKLRQLLPRLESALRQQGWQVSAIRIHVQ